jgi:hypothetical protein
MTGRFDVGFVMVMRWPTLAPRTEEQQGACLSLVTIENALLVVYCHT